MVKRRFLGGVILCLALIASPVLADLPTTVLIGTLPQPAWSQLTTQQKIILAPLANEWEGMENVRKKKWEAYSNLPNEEKQRVREGGKSAKLLTAPPVLPETTTSQTPPRSQNTAQQLPPAQAPSN